MNKFLNTLLLLLVFCLFGCSSPEVKSDDILQEITITPSPQPTMPLHSEFYFDNLSVEDVIAYFNEVCLDAEFVNEGNPNVVQKWTSPVYYSVFGEYTAEDMSKLNGFVSWLNSVDGFPGMYPADNQNAYNLRIYFCDQQTMVNQMGDNYYGMDGGVTFWYNNNEIYDAIICYRTEINQFTRNSVILEEIYNGLGPVQDTDLRTDSIIYSGFSEPQELTAVDELILRLLYHPNIKCGMDAAQCESVIRELYY